MNDDEQIERLEAALREKRKRRRQRAADARRLPDRQAQAESRLAEALETQERDRIRNREIVAARRYDLRKAKRRVAAAIRDGLLPRPESESPDTPADPDGTDIPDTGTPGTEANRSNTEADPPGTGNPDTPTTDLFDFGSGGNAPGPTSTSPDSPAETADPGNGNRAAAESAKPDRPTATVGSQGGELLVGTSRVVEEFRAAARDLGARWSTSTRQWRFPAAVSGKARTLVDRHYDITEG